MCLYLFEHGANINDIDDVDGTIIEGALRISLFENHFKIIEYLIVNHREKIINDILFIVRWASYYGHLSIIKTLNPKTCDCWSLRYASWNSHLEVVKYLIENCGANVHTQNNSALCDACSDGHLEVVKYLIEKCGADVKNTNDEAIKRAVRINSPELIKYLIEHGANENFLTKHQKKYISFCKNMENKRREKAQKKIYFWWVQICYDMNRECGRRMAQKNVENYKKMMEI